jgi:hypothetical protein
LARSNIWLSYSFINKNGVLDEETKRISSVSTVRSIAHYARDGNSKHTQFMEFGGKEILPSATSISSTLNSLEVLNHKFRAMGRKKVIVKPFLLKPIQIPRREINVNTLTRIEYYTGLYAIQHIQSMMQQFL